MPVNVRLQITASETGLDQAVTSQARQISDLHH
jgi:hypothetical protein